MNKVLHVLVYVFLVLAAAALFFELQLNAKRSELTDRNRLQEDYLVKIAKTIEKAEPEAGATFEVKKDASPVEARIVDSPDMENLLEGYPAQLEQANLETFNWDSARDQLRRVYVLDADGNPEMDGNQPMTRGSDEEKLLEKLFAAAKAQQARLNSTRAALADLRGKFDAVVAELNQLKPEARQDKVTIDEVNGKLAEAEEANTSLQNQVTKAKAATDELNTQITSLRDEVNSVRDEADAKNEEIAKHKNTIEQLKKLVQNSIQTTQQRTDTSAAAAVSTVKAGNNKGSVLDADNDNMFAIVEFSPETIDELRGGDASKPLAQMEFGVRRPGYAGAAGEFIGRVRIRQEVKGQNYVVCDILGNWAQDKLAKNDVLFAD